MSEPKVTKADLLRMLADAVRNTPGVILTDPDHVDAKPSKKRPAKTNRAKASSSRKKR
jgi:hypothetical protein